MDIRIATQNDDDANKGSVIFRVTLSLEDIEQLKGQAQRAIEIQRELPADKRSPLLEMSEEAFVAKFIESRAVNDALESRGIIPVATPLVKSSGYVEGEPYTCDIRVVPRPEIGLRSLDPVDLTTRRIPKPGFSAQAAREGAEDVEFVDDEKALRMAMVERLDSELPEAAIRALAAEYQYKFELELAARNIDPASYQLAHGLNEEQYDLMMARRSLSDAHWNFALDAVFVGEGFQVTEDDLITTFELKCPGHGKDLLELHELMNDLHITVEKVRRGKALMWLKKNALK